MDIREHVSNIIIGRGGVAKSADFVAEGISGGDIVRLCNEGYLERVRHGYYSLTDNDL